MNVVIFARGYNIQGQVEYCREYSEKKNYTVVAVIVGQGRELPEIVGGLGMKIDLVIVRDMARLSRNAMENYMTQADLETECGTLVEVASDEPKSEAFDNLMKNIIIATREERTERERAIRKRLILRGMLEE